MFPLEFNSKNGSQISASIGPLQVIVEADHSDLVFQFTAITDDKFFLNRRVMTFSDVCFEVEDDRIEWVQTNSCPKVNVYFATYGHIHFHVTHEGVIIDIWDENTNKDGTVDSIALEWSDFIEEEDPTWPDEIRE